MPRKKQASAPPEKRADMTVERTEGESDDKAIAGLAGSATFRAACTERQIVGKTMGGSELGLFAITDALTERFKKVTDKGDMATPETMLLAQAHTCEAIFHDFTQRALRCDTMPKLESFMKLALKAQQQSASTLRILGELKNPRPVAFVRQANISHGPQQVNNGIATTTHARAHEESGNQSNELLEHHHGEWLDAGTAGEAAGSDTALATVGAEHRAAE